MKKQLEKRILVTGAGGGGSNNLIRGIRKSRYPINIVGTNSDEYLLCCSLADKNYLIPHGDTGEAYYEALMNIIHRDDIELIIPNSDTEVRIISNFRNKLSTRTFLPDSQTIELCQDKLLFSQFLSEHGFPVAKTIWINDLEEVDLIFNEFTGQEKLWCRMRRGAGSQGSLPVNKPEQIVFWINYWQNMRAVEPGSFLLCEYLPGRDFAWQSLWNNGELVIAKTCERLKYFFGRFMPSGTSSTPQLGKAVNNSSVHDICTKVVKKIDPNATGMFCADLKENKEGIPCITEINIGRFFMITYFFNIIGSYNMAELYIRMAFGENILVPEEARYNDIGREETYLIRELDNEPLVITRTQLKNRVISLK